MQAVFLVEKQDAKFLVVEKGHCGPAIIDHCVNKLDSVSRFSIADFGQACRRRLDDLQFDDRGLAEPVDFAQPLGPCRDSFGEGAKARDEGFGERLDVTARAWRERG